jgi:hypothetical protein
LKDNLVSCPTMARQDCQLGWTRGTAKTINRYQKTVHVKAWDYFTFSHIDLGGYPETDYTTSLTFVDSYNPTFH